MTCTRPTKGYIAGATKWVILKGKMNLPHGYCFGYGIPTYDVNLEGHGTMRRKCEWDDFTVQLIYFIKFIPDIWKKAKIAFPSLQLIGEGDDAWYSWLGTVDGTEKLYNGLELVVWLFSAYKEEKK